MRFCTDAHESSARIAKRKCSVELLKPKTTPNQPLRSVVETVVRKSHASRLVESTERARSSSRLVPNERRGGQLGAGSSGRMLLRESHAPKHATRVVSEKTKKKKKRHHKKTGIAAPWAGRSGGRGAGRTCFRGGTRRRRPWSSGLDGRAQRAGRQTAAARQQRNNATTPRRILSFLFLFFFRLGQRQVGGARRTRRWRSPAAAVWCWSGVRCQCAGPGTPLRRSGPVQRAPW